MQDENSCRLRDLLRLPAADANDPAVERASLARSRSAQLGSHAARSADPGQHLSRRFRQFLPRHPRARGPADHVHRFLVQDNGEPDAVAPRGAAACARRLAGGHAGLPARQPLLRDRSPGGYRLVAVRQVSRRAGRWCRRSATTSTTASRSATNTPARPRRRGTPIRSGAACAATSPISRSRCAAA